MTGAASATAAFAPSEMVLLFGDRFAPEAGMLASKEEVLTSGAKVNSQKLMDAAMKAALYAVHRSGAARLEVQAGKALFGLVKTAKLYLRPGTGAAAFPAGSLEARLVEQAGPERQVVDVLAEFIGEEVNNPPARALALMKRGLAERGLLDAEQRKSLVVFTVTDYVLPAATRAAAEAQPLEPVQELLRETEQREPELDRAVQKAIDAARVRMTASHDD